MLGIRSIRLQFQLIYGLVTIVLLTVLIVVVYQWQKTSLISLKDNYLQTRLVRILPELTPGQRGLPKDLFTIFAEDFLINYLKEDEYVQVWGRDQQLIDSFGVKQDKLVSPEIRGDSSKMYFRTQGPNRELINYHRDGNIIIIGKSLNDEEKNLEKLLSHLVIIGFGIFISGGIGIFFATRSITSPLEKICKSAQKVTMGLDKERIQLSTVPKEIEALASAVNDSYEHLESVLKDQRRFSADVSHELRTPITAILLQTELSLRKSREEDEYRKSLESCQSHAESMKRIINSLLELSRLETGTKNLEMNEFAICALANESWSNVSHLASPSHTFKIETCNTELQVTGDRQLLSQAFMNLFSNSIIHNKSGCDIRIKFELKESEVHIFISDNGIGFDEVTSQKLFQRFFQADTSRSNQSETAGLGMSIVESIIHAHRGTISANGSPGNGASFQIVLPS